MTNDAKTSARQAFRRARGQHLFRAIWTALNGESNELLKWEEIRRKLRAGTPIYRGVQSVEVALIQGSVNRYRDFDRAFMPSQAHTRARWWSIGEARYSDVDLPPVQLYKVGEVYFVMDGNHRVSVARQLGQEFIDAEVYESRVRVPVRPDISPESLDVISEKLDFVEYTGIDELRPAVDIELSLRGGYYRLLEHIETHRYLQGQEWEREFTLEEAVVQWVDQVYLPTVEVIRQTGVLEDFPERTEADLYMWIREHYWFLYQEFGDGVELQDAAQHFADHFSSKPLKRIWRWIVDRLPGHHDDPVVHKEQA